MSIRLIQYLCPDRHCLIAMAYNSAEQTREQAIELLTLELKKINAAHECGICGSNQLFYEDQSTGFHSIEQARPHLLSEESAQMLTRLVIEIQKRHGRNN